MAGYAGISHGAALSSGTAAIHLALKLAGVQEGDIVFVPTLTFSATCNPVVYEKAVPLLLPVHRRGGKINPFSFRHFIHSNAFLLHLCPISSMIMICRYDLPDQWPDIPA